MKLVCSQNIFSFEVNSYIKNLLQKNENYLYLTNSPDVNAERKKSEQLESFFKNNNRIMFFEKFINVCSKHVIKSKNYLPNIDISFILEKIINTYCKSETNKRIFHDTHIQLLNLYKLLMFNGVKFISSDVIKAIKENNTNFEEDIFLIYNYLLFTITDIVKTINSGERRYENDALGIQIAAPNKADEKFNTYIELFKNQIYNAIRSAEVLILDGFFYLTEQLTYIVRIAKELNKDIIIITKDIETDHNAKFLIDDIKNKIHIDSHDISFLTFHTNQCDDSSLRYLSHNFFKADVKNDKPLCDDSIRIYKPFLNKQQELKFVVQKISSILRENNTDDIDKLSDIIKNQIVIVTMIDYNELAEAFDQELKKVGLFVLKKNTSAILKKEVDIRKINKIYYNANDFISSNIYYVDGIELTIDEKLFFFSNAFKRISIKSHRDLLLKNSVLEYILQLYNIVKEGISIKKFKNLLFSNWYYHIGISECKWDKYIGTLNQIETFLKDDVPITDWTMQINDILIYKSEISENQSYKFHPYNSINYDELKFILNLLEELNVITSLLAVLKGDIQKHLEFLRKYIIKNEEIIFEEYINLSSEKQTIKKFYEILEATVSTSTISYLDTASFALHLKSLLDKVNENNENEEDNDNFYLKLSSSVNLKKYKYTFFVSCERNKYPRKNKRTFPFTDRIFEILTSENYGLNLSNLPVKDSNLHIKLEKYLFKNIIDFTTDTIYYTCSQYLGRNEDSYSIYLKEIFDLFKNGIKICKSNFNDFNSSNRQIINYVNNKKCRRKPEYTLKELITFQLCPKLYYQLYISPAKIAYKNRQQLKLYAEAIIYSDILDRFMDYNYENKKWYYSDSKEYYVTLQSIAKQSFINNFKYFDCLKTYELNNIRDRVLSRILHLIEGYIVNKLNYNKFTIVKSKGNIYSSKSLKLILEYDLEIFSDQRGSRKIEQSKTYLDFLTLKCTYKNIEETHYNEMLQKLHSNNKYTDRVYFANRMLSKINVQFDSKNKYFILGPDGGVERVNRLINELLDYDFSKLTPCSSDFCSYCIISDICMGKKEIYRDIEVIE